MNLKVMTIPSEPANDMKPVGNNIEAPLDLKLIHL